MLESRISAGATEKLPCSENLSISSWSYDMEGHAKKCVERYCELANKIQLNNSTKYQLHALTTIISKKIWNVYTWHVLDDPIFCGQWKNLHDRSQNGPKHVTNDLSRLISCIHTCEYKQYCHVGNTAKQCRLGLIQDSDFAADLEDSESTSGGTLCILGSHTLVPISWMCKKHTLVSYGSTESEIISLDAGLRMDGIPALWFMGSDRHSSSRKHESEWPCTGRPV